MGKEQEDSITEPVDVREMKRLQDFIYVIRGKQVMIDSDLAMLYQVETKNLNRAVKRNEQRFPNDFCFQLTKAEYENLRCQIGTSSEESAGHGGRRYEPYVFTEQGIAMLSAVLKSDVAVQMSICIMKAFVEMRTYMANSAFLYERVNAVERRQILYQEKTDEKLEQIFEYIASHEESRQKIFFDGQIFDAFSLMVELIGRAEDAIELIDGYVDVTTLNILSKKRKNVNVCIYTHAQTRLTNQDVVNFNKQYPTLEVKYTNVFHDRFLILDKKEAYHIGASMKDAGKKCFAINRIEDAGIVQAILERLS